MEGKRRRVRRCFGRNGTLRESGLSTLRRCFGFADESDQEIHDAALAALAARRVHFVEDRRGNACLHLHSVLWLGSRLPTRLGHEIRRAIADLAGSEAA